MPTSRIQIDGHSKIAAVGSGRGGTERGSVGGVLEAQRSKIRPTYNMRPNDELTTSQTLWFMVHVWFSATKRRGIIEWQGRRRRKVVACSNSWRQPVGTKTKTLTTNQQVDGTSTEFRSAVDLPSLEGLS